MNTTPILPDEQMRALGFTDRNPANWYLVKRLDDATTLNVTIVKATGVWDELVMDEDFGQPAYYGHMNEPYRSTIRDGVDAIIGELTAAGLTVAVDHREYKA